MMRRSLCFIIFLSVCGLSSPAQLAAKPDPFASISFLLGTWSANTNTPAGTAAASASGSYSFHRDLAGHAIARTSSADSCKGAQDFDCKHNDQLTIFVEPDPASGKPALAALYIDSEGHVIHYAVTTPDPHTAMFLSTAAPGAPRFRLLYHLQGEGSAAVMTGKFQMAAPGSEDFHSYLEWSGPKQ